MGALINPWTVLQNPGQLAALVALVVVGNGLIWTVVVRLFGYPLPTALMVGVGLTQLGEFSFILIKVARDAGHVGADLYQATLAASLITILVNAALMRTVPAWVGRLQLGRGTVPVVPDATSEPTGHIVLCGFGRVGSAVAEALETFSRPYVAIERDPEIVRGLRARGVPCVYGDASNRRILAAAGAERAALAVIALPEAEQAHVATDNLHALNPGLPILTRTHDPEARERLVRAGASEVIQPELEAAATLIRHALRRLAVPRDTVLDYLDRFRRAMDVGDDVPPETLPGVRTVVVAPGELADQSLREARIRERFGVTVLSIERPGQPPLLHPAAETVVRSGDVVHVFGLPAQIKAFVEAAAVAE
jgi:CPA2 family monovalent cation:H+ antiporter-2